MPLSGSAHCSTPALRRTEANLPRVTELRLHSGSSAPQQAFEARCRVTGDVRYRRCDVGAGVLASSRVSSW